MNVKLRNILKIYTFGDIKFLQMYKSLREYVEFLEAHDELVRVKEFVDPVFEITEYTDRMSKLPGGGKAILFENTGTQFPVLTNMMGSIKRILHTLGAESFEEITGKIDALMGEAMAPRKGMMDKLKLLPTLAEAAKWLPKEYKKSVPPCQEVIMAKPDLNRLPILKCWPQDGGKFITFPLVHTNDPVTGMRNVGMYRMQVFTENSTGMHWHKHKTGARHYQEFKGDKMPITVCLGGDPVYTYAATAPLPDGIDEYLLAGFLRGKGVELTKCLTNDIMVPADCDFVIEGYVDKREAKVVEGPFGDHTGFYSLADLYPTFHITCISHRKDAIYPATIVGVPPQEDKYIAIATEKIFLAPIKFAIGPEIEDLYLPEEGVGHNFGIIKIKKRYPGQAVKIAHAMWGAGQMMFNKMLVVVDGDIDIRDHRAVADYVAIHYNPKRDTYFSRGPLDVLDHTAPVCGFGGKLCIDATEKLPEEGGVCTPTESSAQTGGNIGKRFIKFIHPKYPDADINSPAGNEIDVSCDALVAVILDSQFALDDIYHNLWILGGNVDPIRDCRFERAADGSQVLVMDARCKKYLAGFTRDWPDIVESAGYVKESVAKKFTL